MAKVWKSHWENAIMVDGQKVLLATPYGDDIAVAIDNGNDAIDYRIPVSIFKDWIQSMYTQLKD